MEWVHEGVTIQVNPQGLFVYRIEGNDGVSRTLDEARESITRMHKAARHSDYNAINLSVLSRRGEPVTLRRIHEGTGDWLTEPKDVEPPYYVNSPGVGRH